MTNVIQYFRFICSNLAKWNGVNIVVRIICHHYHLPAWNQLSVYLSHFTRWFNCWRFKSIAHDSFKRILFSPEAAHFFLCICTKRIGFLFSFDLDSTLINVMALVLNAEWSNKTLIQKSQVHWRRYNFFFTFQCIVHQCSWT